MLLTDRLRDYLPMPIFTLLGVLSASICSLAIASTSPVITKEIQPYSIWHEQQYKILFHKVGSRGLVVKSSIRDVYIAMAKSGKYGDQSPGLLAVDELEGFIEAYDYYRNGRLESPSALTPLQSAALVAFKSSIGCLSDKVVEANRLSPTHENLYAYDSIRRLIMTMIKPIITSESAIAIKNYYLLASSVDTEVCTDDLVKDVDAATHLYNAFIEYLFWQGDFGSGGAWEPSRLYEAFSHDLVAKCLSEEMTDCMDVFETVYR